jgi:NADH:ubiquinone oxidoreductase subunit F (NADH-binding)
MLQDFLWNLCRRISGKCFPCRVGTKRMLEILERITKGKGREGDIQLLEDLGNMIKDRLLFAGLVRLHQILF